MLTAHYFAVTQYLYVAIALLDQIKIFIQFFLIETTNNQALAVTLHRISFSTQLQKLFPAYLSQPI